jgi:RTX calcium-binding nonapeptide repeat (4 copies)
MRLPLGRSLIITTLAAFTTLALFLAPSVADRRGEIVIYGAHSGSTLRISTSHKGKRIVVKGIQARTRPQGCRLNRHRMRAVCRVRGHGSMRVVMGPSGDLVRVAKRLPMPLTVYLGPGSDKFVGNGERDTCFSQGSRRNRCVGRGGKDICITGPRNSDCVGGGGNDYCHHGTGSDGCWGGRGRDVCVMGPGQDGCHGGRGNDRLYGGPQPDQLYGGRGNDYCNGGRGWGKSHHCDRGPRR